MFQGCKCRWFSKTITSTIFNWQFCVSYMRWLFTAAFIQSWRKPITLILFLPVLIEILEFPWYENMFMKSMLQNDEWLHEHTFVLRYFFLKTILRMDFLNSQTLVKPHYPPSQVLITANAAPVKFAVRPATGHKGRKISLCFWRNCNTVLPGLCNALAKR